MNLGIIGAIGGLGAGTALQGNQMVQADVASELARQRKELEQMRLDSQKELQENSQLFHGKENDKTRATTERGQDLQADASREGQETTERGQDITERVGMAHVAATNAHTAAILDSAKNQGLSLQTDDKGNTQIIDLKNGTVVPLKDGEGNPFRLGQKTDGADPASIAKLTDSINMVPEGDLKERLKAFVTTMISNSAGRRGDAGKVTMPGAPKAGSSDQTGGEGYKSTSAIPSGVINSALNAPSKLSNQSPAEQLKEINMRLALPGISPETKNILLAQRDELVSIRDKGLGLPSSSDTSGVSNWLPGSR